MTPLVAVVVLQGVALVLVVLALVGLQQNLRRLERRVGRAGARRRGATELTALRPLDGANLSCVLLVSDHCPICASVLPAFIEPGAADRSVERLVLSRVDLTQHDVGPLRTVVDRDLYDALDPGWQPALAMVDAGGEVLAIRPAGSVDAVRALLGTAAERAGR